MPIIRSTEVNQQTAYDVQHWSCCVRVAEKRQVHVHLLGLKRRRRRNNQIDADKLRFIDVVSSTCFGHHYAHHQEYRSERTDGL
jgi:hypothetical protein